MNVTRSHWPSSTYRLSSSVARVESRGGQNKVAPGRAQKIKQGVASAVGLGGGSIDLLLGSVSPLHGESFMPCEILNGDKRNVGERLLFEKLPERNWGPGKILERKILRSHTH